MHLEEKKKNYNDILLNLCLTKDDKIESVLYKLIPLLLDEILTSEICLRKTLIEIISNCILRCKSFENIKIPFLKIIDNYFQNINKESTSRILYNSTLCIFLDLGFKNVNDEDKIRFQQIIIKNADQLTINKEICICMIIKFIECLEVLNNNKNKDVMNEYISIYSKSEDNKIIKFVEYINEFLLIPIYCKDFSEIKFLDADVIKNYKQKLFDNKNYSVKNHIKMKKNVLNFLSNFIKNDNLAFSSYIICSFEKYDEIKDFANSLIQSKKRFIDFNNISFINLNFEIIKYFDNKIYSFNYIIKILSLFQNSSILANHDKYLRLILSYIFFFFFFYDVNNSDFLKEFTKFKTIFNDETKFTKYLSENKYSIKLKNVDMLKCLFDLMLSILENTKNIYIQYYNNYIFHLLFCFLKEKYDDNNNYNFIANISTITENFLELNNNDEKINLIVLNKSFILTYIFFDKLKRYKKNKNDSYVIYNNIIKVLSSLEKYYKNIINMKSVENETYLIYKKINITDINIENISFEINENSNEDFSKYEKCKSLKYFIIQNIVNLLDKFIIFSDNILLISAILKWSVNIFCHTSCEFRYYSLLYENSNDIILSDVAKDYLNLYKESKLSFDKYIFFISKKLFNIKDIDTINFFTSNICINQKKNEDKILYENENNDTKDNLDYTTMYNNFFLINDMESLIEYSNINYQNFNIQHLHNLIKYIDNINFTYFSFTESINYTILILDIFLLHTVNFENILKVDNFILYCTIFLSVIKNLKNFLSNSEKLENSKNCKDNVLKNSQIIYSNIQILIERRLHLILNNLLYTENNKLIKATSKLLTKIYMLKKENNCISFDNLINFLISMNFEKIDINSKKEINMTCSLIFFFGNLIKKEKVFYKKYYGILEKITNYFLYIYFNYITENKNFENIIFKYCINFFYLTFFSKNLLHSWKNIIRENSYAKLKHSSDDYIFIYPYITRIFMKILYYAKEDINKNLSLVKNILKFLSCLPTLKDKNINTLLKEDIKCTLHLEQFQIQKLYAHYISHIFLKLDQINSNHVSYDFLKYIFDSCKYSSDCDHIETRNKFVCIIMFYIIYYNPFLEYIKENACAIGDFFMSIIKIRSDIYSEYSFLGLSVLFFSLSIQCNLNINDIYLLEKNFKFLKKEQCNSDIKHIAKVDFFLNNKKTNTNSLNKIEFKSINTVDCPECKINIKNNIHKKKEMKNIDFTFLNKGKSYFNSLSIFYEENIDELNSTYEKSDKNIYNNMYMKKVDKFTIEKYVETLYNFFNNIGDNSLYKILLRKKEREVDDTFITEIKKFECKKDYVLKNIYENINNEGNYDLINHYICLSRYCFNYIYIFLFMQYSDLMIFNYDKKIKEFFFFPDFIYDKSYEISHLLNKTNNVIDNFSKNEKELCNIPFFRDDIDNVFDFKKVNKRFCIIVKYIYKKLLISEIKARNEIIKFKIFQFVSIKDVSKTMIKIEKDFLKMNYEVTESICCINALNIELTNFFLTNNEIINEAILRFLIEFLNKMDLKIFAQEIFYYLFFICTIINSYILDIKLCITFLNTFKSCCIKFSNIFEQLSLEDKIETNIFLCYNRNKDIYEDGNKDDYEKLYKSFYSNINIKNYNDINDEYFDDINKEVFNNISNINVIIFRLLQYHKKKIGDKKLELYFIDCLNSCIISCVNINFNLKILLEFYITNSEKLENNYNELKINDNKNENETYKEKEIFFGKLAKYNNSDKQKEVLEKIVGNYSHASDVEETIKYILTLLNHSNDKFILSNISFTIIKLLIRYEALSDNIFLIVNLYINVFGIISDFISKNLHKNYLVYVNDLLYYLVNNIPFYHYIKFVNSHLLKDHSELYINVGDIQNIRNYSSIIILYLLKKNLLIDLDDEQIFRDKKKVDNIRIFEEMKIINSVIDDIKEFLKINNFKMIIQKESTYLESMDKDIFNDDLSSEMFSKLIEEIKDNSKIICYNIISYINENNYLVVDEYENVENMIKNEIKGKLNSFKYEGTINMPLICSIIDIITKEIINILKKEFNRKKLFDEENKRLLVKIESKLISRSFIIMNIKNCENYKNVYEILQKRNIFHFYKFFNEYIEEFHIFIDSKFLKDKKASLISMDNFIESFIDIYKSDNYDELDSGNIHNFLDLYVKLKSLLREYSNSDINHFIIFPILKSLNFIFLLIFRRKQKENLLNIKNYINISEKKVDIDLCELYYTFDDILDVFIKVKDYEIFQHMYIFLFNIPSFFIRNFNFVKLYKCITFFMNIYFKNSYEIDNYDSNFYLHFSKLSICIFSFFLVKNNLNVWLNFFNFEFLNKFIKMDNLNSYIFDIDKISNEEDIFKNIYFYENNFFNNNIKVDVEKNNFVDILPSKGIYKYINDNRSESLNDNNRNLRDDETIEVLEINKNLYSNIKEEFFDYLRKLLFILFENSKNNYNILSLIKTFFQFMFYNKIYFFEVGNTKTWEKIYNYIYLLIKTNKTKKVFEHLMHILNILLCIYNSYSYKNENDRNIYLDIKINEFYNYYDESNDNRKDSPNFIFVMFFKIREKSKELAFPNYIIQNLKYSIMLNFPHFFL
ncbi:conserved Plasmodium protein, unknown function [Plasmodium relictum]|uniref:Uncharacterized protein n=1 Tax=Plasmodium relictum TaxID=85471 RepID=A0A1J1GKI6_PLARL|nr:conserved Plasmodium protein, unknown function [Plasmodium relictum]CRG85356.1 conserved Plasmodium protein, unknown function [Plasmodium relictum]